MHHLLDEAGEGARFRRRRPSGRVHRPEIDSGQFPIPEYRFDCSVRDFGREHPFRSDSDAGVGQDGRAYALGGGDTQATLQRDRKFRAVAPKGPDRTAASLGIARVSYAPTV